MGKLLSWILLIAIGYAVYRFVVISKRRSEASRRGKPADAKEGATSVETMVRCDRCGVHLPASDAISHSGRHYCSAAHRDGR